MQPVPCPAVQPVPCPPVQPVLCSVLVLSSRGWPYDAMKEAWLANWERHAPPDCTLHFLHGRDGGPPPGGRHDLVVECEEALVPGALAKTLDGIVQVLREHDPAYVFRTNLSSHVDLQQLASFLQTCPRNDFASGCSPRRDHLCGAGYALSADLAGRLLTAPLEWGLLDDLAVSRWLLALPDVQVHWAARLDLVYADGVEDHNAGQPLYHVRCKHDDRRRDVALLHQLARTPIGMPKHLTDDQ